LVMGFAVFFGPALVIAAVTLFWFRSRRVRRREAGA